MILTKKIQGKLVANAFNNHFANIGNELLAKLLNVQN